MQIVLTGDLRSSCGAGSMIWRSADREALPGLMRPKKLEAAAVFPVPWTRAGPGPDLVEGEIAVSSDAGDGR